MKKIITILVTGLVMAGCGTSVSGNAKDNTKTSGTGNMQNDYSNSAAVNLVGSVSVTGMGNDEPIGESNQNVAKISSALVSIFDSSDKLIKTIKLTKVRAGAKGQVLKFDSGFIAIASGPTRFKFDFNDSENKILFSTEEKADLKAKTVFVVTGDLNQTSIKKDPQGPVMLKTLIDERKAGSFVAGEFILSLKDEIDEVSLKSLLEANGIKVSSLTKGILKNYTVKVSSPSVAEALIIASQTGKFEYVELNGYGSIQTFKMGL